MYGKCTVDSYKKHLTVHLVLHHFLNDNKGIEDSYRKSGQFAPIVPKVSGKIYTYFLPEFTDLISVKIFYMILTVHCPL